MSGRLRGGWPTVALCDGSILRISTFASTSVPAVPDTDRLVEKPASVVVPEQSA
jgi:hypothetical protein